MNTNQRHFANFHIAGFTYYDGVDVFDQLKIGKELLLKSDPDNQYDARAVAIYFGDTQLGYVPRTENREIRKFLDLGHDDLFEVKISQVSPDADPEHQVRVIVKIRKK
jgi:hypothetical protein